MFAAVAVGTAGLVHEFSVDVEKLEIIRAGGNWS